MTSDDEGPIAPESSHVPDSWGAYLHAWARAHGGHDPATGGRAERAWFVLVYRLAQPLRRVPPDLLTLAAVLAAGGAVLAAAGGATWCLAAAVLVAGSALLDGLDGAVAVLAGRASRWGHLIDSLGDRVAEAAFGVALGLAGAPWPVVAGAVALGWLQEYARARAGVPEILVVTVAERPTRVLAAMLGLLGVGVGVDAGATVGAALSATLGAAGLAQVVAALRSALR